MKRLLYNNRQVVYRLDVGKLRETQFRDPIYGFITVDPLELELINSSPFQRLRHIKQLATSYLVYHGAEHTRFGHSLGVMHLVSRVFDSAVENFEKRNEKPLFDKKTQLWYRQLLRLIALVHDLGHPPFSHAGEGVFEDGLKHEDFTKKIIFEKEVADIICRIGNRTVEELKAKKYNITPELIWLIYGEKDSIAVLNKKYIMPDFKFLKSFMDSDLDCDKMDYLLRDSHYCGVNYGKYDINRLISSLTVYKNEEENILNLAVERGGLQAFEEFVVARYFMFVQVYFHKTRRYMDMLLNDLLKMVLPTITRSMPAREYLQHTDNSVLEAIEIIKAAGNETAEAFIGRKVMRCVYESKTQAQKSDDMAAHFLASGIRNHFPNIQIREDLAKKLPTEFPVLERYDADSGKSIPVYVKHSDKPESLASESELLKGLDKAISIKRIYVERNRAAEVEAYIREIQQKE